jgi:hypothetical protein
LVNSIPPGSELGEMLMVGQLTNTVYNISALQPFASVNPTSKLYCPTFVGMPEITPLVDNASPGGMGPTAKKKFTGTFAPLAVRV